MGFWQAEEQSQAWDHPALVGGYKDLQRWTKAGWTTHCGSENPVNSVSLWCSQLFRKTQSDPQSPYRDFSPSCHGHRGLDAHT